MSINCTLNFVAITIPEETRKHSWRPETYQLLKNKVFQETFFGFAPTPQLHFSPTLLPLAGLMLSYQQLNSISVLAPELYIPGWPLNLKFREIREKSWNLILASKVREFKKTLAKVMEKKLSQGKKNAMHFPLLTSVSKVSSI